MATPNDFPKTKPQHVWTPPNGAAKAEKIRRAVNPRRVLAGLPKAGDVPAKQSDATASNARSRRLQRNGWHNS